MFNTSHILKVLLLFILLTTLSSAQVGINTTSPQETLHIAGDDTTNIKVEGLSAANNVNNLGIGNSTRVYANGNGDLTLATSPPSVEIVLDFSNYLDDNGVTVNQTGGGSAFTRTNRPLNTTFTLVRDAIIQINYSVSWSIRKNNNFKISDQRARIIQTGIYLVDDSDNSFVTQDLDGNAINPATVNCNLFGDLLNCLGTEALLGLSGQFYNNSSRTVGEANGFHNTGSDYVRLPAGTYKALFAVQVSVGNASGSGNIQFKLGTANDDIQIIAYYYN